MRSIAFECVRVRTSAWEWVELGRVHHRPRRCIERQKHPQLDITATGRVLAYERWPCLPNKLALT